MKDKDIFIEKKHHWIDRLIFFVAFMGGVLLSTTVYSDRPTNNEGFISPKVDDDSITLVLEENLVRMDRVATKEVLQESLRQRAGSSVEADLDPMDEYLLWGLDFSPTSQPISIKIYAEKNQGDRDLPIEISFIPDEHCEFGDGSACIYPLHDSTGKQIILASVHSGVGGEAEAFRDFLEGTGFNQGYYQLAQVTRNSQSLQGSAVEISQAGQMHTGLQLIKILRIPPEHLDAYMALPVERTFSFAVEINGVDPEIFDQTLLIFETCGWQLPDEDPIDGHTITSSSVYLGIIGLIDDQAGLP